MNMDRETYKKYADAHAPSSPMLKNCLWAFFSGGLICAVGQCLIWLFSSLGFEDKHASTLTSVTIVFVAVILTALGLFEKIAKHTGAGTLVPISGFANSVASSAIDSRSEGLVLGVGAKIFTVAGPVLLYGTLAGVVWGIIYFIIGLF
ncbi:MAG: stage V sporulation protein AC [Clostridia bacterium]|nr:stage V sporulation protein AC [Clostridia bacterium]